MVDENTEINKIKVVLLALWNDENHPEATKIIEQFKEDIAEIERGNYIGALKVGKSPKKNKFLVI